MTVRLPNALLIGVQKSGTTSLFNWLGQHPEVYVNDSVKDTPFFWHDPTFEKGGQYYGSFFKGAKKESVLLGGNVNDIFFEASAERIHLLNPDMKLIVCLRNPLERAYSAYAYAVQRGQEVRTFDEAILQEINGIKYKNLIDETQKDYLKHGNYWRQIERFLTFFDESKIHIILLDDLRRDSSVVIKKAYEFLEVDANFEPDFIKKNETKAATKLNIINRIIFDLSLRQPLWWRILKSGFSKKLRYRLRRIPEIISSSKPDRIAPPTEHVRELMKKYYSDEIESLSLYLGRDLRWLE